VKLTTEALSKFVGGYLEVRSMRWGFMLRAKIKRIETNETSSLIFVWLDKGDEESVQPKEEDRVDYFLDLYTCTVTSVSRGRIVINFPVMDEISVFSPLYDTKVKPQKSSEKPEEESPQLKDSFKN